MPLNNKILFKRSEISGIVPSVNSLSAGEIALNIADGKIFFKKIQNSQESIIEFINSNDNPYILNKSLSSVTTQYGNNSANQVFALALGGLGNKSSGAGSTIVNGESNEITSDFAFIGTGYGNKIHPTGDYSAILGGQNNHITHKNSFTLGSNLSSHSENFTYVNNLSAQDLIYGDGSNLKKINASNISSGTLNASILPTFNGDITASTASGTVSATVVAIQGEPISTQAPNIGQVLQWTGTAWTPGAITTGGSGGGGVVYYLNFGNQAQAPTTNLPSTPNTPRELGLEGTIASSSVTINNISTTGYDLICGFVSLTGSPGSVTIPAGLWDFNIWASATSTTTKQTSLLLNVYKYDGSNIPTLLASSGDIFIYDPITTAQYIASVVFPQTTLLETDRIYIELTAKATQNNKNITIYFGGTTPTHVHTTFPSVRGSGLVKVINGVYQSPASLLVNTDVAANAAIDQSKINGLTDVENKTNTTYTTVQTNSANWDAAYSSVGTDLMVRSLTGLWDSTYNTVGSLSSNWNTAYLSTTALNLSSSNWNTTFTNVQSNSSNWQTAYAYVSANSVNLTATNIFVNNNLTVNNTFSAKYFQGTLIDWMTLVRGYKTVPTLLQTIAGGEIYTYVYATTGTDKTYYRYIATDGSEDSFYGNFTNPTLSNLIARKAIIL
jgi:hypothetical protein